MLDREAVNMRVERELRAIRDPALLDVIRKHLVEPCPVEREWDYGAAGQTYVCWTILEHRPSNTAIAFCDQGFGPGDPWGLVSLTGPNMSIGMDAEWFTSLEDAVRGSQAWEGANPPGYEVS